MLMLKRLLRSEKMSQKDLAAQLGIDEASMSLIVNGRRDMSIEMRKAIDALFGVEKVAQFDIQPITQPTQVQATIYPTGVIDDLRDEIKAELSQPKAEDVEVVEAIEVPYVPEDLAAKPNTNVRELVRADKVDRVNVMDLLGSFDFVQPVFRQAMAPLYNRGDLLFLRYLQLTNGDTIPDGEYMVDTMKYGSMLGHVHDEGDGSFTISYVNPLYSPLNIRKEDAASIAVVVNHLRAGGSSMDYDMVRMLNVKETQLSDALRIIEKSGDRTDRLIEQFLLKKNN